MSTILVVQPDPMLEKSWSAALARDGHAVLLVANTEEGAARAREGGIDVVVLDAIGGEPAVRSLCGELERLPEPPPLVLVSESPTAPELSARVGAAGFLPKPCAVEDLLELVSRVASAAVRAPIFDDETTAPRDKF